MSGSAEGLTGRMTWTVRPDLACWHFGVGPRDALQSLDANSLDAWLDALILRCVNLAQDFAHPQDHRHAPDLYRASSDGDAIVSERDGLSSRRVVLDLDCLDADGAPLIIERGAELRIRAWLRPDGALELRRMHPVELTLAVHTDIAAPLPARQPLARLNGPRLAGFLRRLETEVPAELYGIEAPGYERLAAACGFHEEDKHGRAC